MRIGDFLFGKGKAGPDWAERQASYGAMWGLGNQSGATFTGVEKGGAGDRPIYDYSTAFQPKSVEDSKKPYSFGKFDEGMAGFKDPAQFKETYNPYQFNFAGLPKEYGQKAYELGAKDVRREGQGQLKQLQQSMGTRRPGLLMKAGQDSQRNTAEQLASLNSQIRLQEMADARDLGVDQQKSQAGENYKGYESKSSLERANADEMFRNKSAYTDAAAKNIGLESDINQRERDQTNTILAMLMDFLKSKGAQRAGDKGSSGALGDVAGIGSSIAGIFGG